MATKPTNMRLSDEALENLDNVQKLLKVSRTRATAHSIKIAHTILNRLDQDGAINIVRPGGTTERIIFFL